jgi:mannosyltransferase OCH1-like enzyme
LIPKILHFCWFGRASYPDQVKKCMESWDRLLPDYQKVLWNEDNFDINSNLYVKQAYDAKKYAFVSDYVRLYALYHYGGIYLDTDVEVVKNFDPFLEHAAFAGFEDEWVLSSGTMGAIQHHPWIYELLELYKDRVFIYDDGSWVPIPNVVPITELTEWNFGLQRGNDRYQVLKSNLHIYPRDYFSPKSFHSRKITLTENTHTIHHFLHSWG